jgi:hypothetical protein
MLEFLNNLWGREPRRNRVVVPTRQCWNFRAIYGVQEPSRNTVVAGCPSYNIFILIGECWFFLNDQHSPIKKKFQSSKSWYLQIALILSIENPLPRGVLDKAVNTNPEVRGIEPPLKHLHKSKNEFKQSLL